MTSNPAQPSKDTPIPREPRMQYSQLNNVRAVPQLEEHDRDQFGPIPFVMLRGKWLRKFGFEVGVHVRIEAREGYITVRPLWQDALPDFDPMEAEYPAIRYAEVEDR